MTGLDASARGALRHAAQAGAAPIEAGNPEAARAAYLQGFSADQLPLEDVAESSEIRVGALRLRLWRGQGAPATGAPALLYLHGGGWVIGAPETHEDICRALANRVGAVVISPDYRLAPEHPFPAALTDCAQALQYISAQYHSLGIDPARIVVGGDSAGGNLAAVLALMARDGRVPPVLAQLLVYPVTDQRQGSDSYRRYAEGFGLTSNAMAWFRDHYAAAATDWRASPLLVPSLHGVAPAFVVLAGHDVLHDEGAAYAARLAREATATLRVWPGQIHGFVSMSRVIPEASEALTAIAEAWRGFDPGLRSPVA
ncbi:MAG: alpha/beta hydrolase [Rhodobacteraceae bacterium]|nr:alpha/beta hydrolase [Paracoccaceae bacterium]